MTAQGNPRAIFRRALERGNLLTAELTVREIGRISLDESLALTALIAQKDPQRHSRLAARWLLRLLEEHAEWKSLGTGTELKGEPAQEAKQCTSKGWVAFSSDGWVAFSSDGWC